MTTTAVQVDLGSPLTPAHLLRAAAPLDVRRWLFVNTELTIHLHRPPEGEWMGVDARTIVGPSGVGTVSGLLFDEHGHIGRSAQCLTVRRRT